jgi:hypothetical protein
MRRFVSFVIALVLAVCVSAGPPDPSGEEILAKVEALYTSIDDYTVTLDIDAHLERLTVPPMHVTLYFKKPDKVHIVSEGFAMLPREGMGFDFGKLRAVYMAESVRRDTLAGRPVYAVGLRPRDKKRRDRTATLFVQPDRWTPERLVVEREGTRLITADFRHERIQERWLPALLTVTLAPAPADSADFPLDKSAVVSRRPVPPSGSVIITYTDYKINSGLPDSLFEQKERE